jgi:cytoskeletal protein RodZ
MPPANAHLASPVSGATGTAGTTPAVGISPDASRKVQRVALMISGAGIVVFGAIAAIAYPRLIAETKAYAAAEERFRSRPVAEEETPEPAAPSPAQKADPAKQPAAQSPATATMRPTPVTKAVTPAAPAVVATTAAAKTSGAPSPATTAPATPAPAAVSPAAGANAFNTWVANVKISGVRGGSAPRILIGRASFNLGEVVNEELGITFEGYDADRHLVRFRDRTGATAERRDR